MEMGVEESNVLSVVVWKVIRKYDGCFARRVISASLSTNTARYHRAFPPPSFFLPSILLKGEKGGEERDAGGAGEKQCFLTAFLVNLRFFELESDLSCRRSQPSIEAVYVLLSFGGEGIGE